VTIVVVELRIHLGAMWHTVKRWAVEADWTDVRRVVKYLRRTSNYGLLFGACNIKGMLEAFRDAGFLGDVRKDSQ